MKLSDRLSDVRQGFHPSFWVANGMELFERLAYYGQQTVLSVFLRDHLRLSEIQAGQLSSIFGGLIYLLPIFAGTLADKFGFRRAFSFAFLVLCLGYFLIGSTGMVAFSGIYQQPASLDPAGSGTLPLYGTLVVILILTAIGGSFIKPSVLGTVAVTSSPGVKSFGYAIYYWLVNMGAALGPLIAYFVRDKIGIQYVYLVSSVSCLLMLMVNLAFYKEVKEGQAGKVESLGAKLKDMVIVLKNAKFMVFLLIFSLYWITFWQIFIIVPFYIKDFISPDAPFEIIQSTGAWAIIALQLVINRLTHRTPTRHAIVIGFGISSLCWLIIAVHPTVWTIIAGIVVLSIGEMTQAPRYYEYVSDLAPRGQQGLFQGYAFLPIAIGWFVGGNLAGWLYTTYAKGSAHPSTVFWFVFGIGLAAMLLMQVYNMVVAMRERASGTT